MKLLIKKNNYYLIILYKLLNNDYSICTNRK